MKESKPSRNNESKKELTLYDVLSHAEYIKSVLHAMGNNDYEFSFIDSILKEVQENKITPKEAILKLNSILDKKQLR